MKFIEVRTIRALDLKEFQAVTHSHGDVAGTYVKINGTSTC